jgi:hypothetical protein
MPPETMRTQAATPNVAAWLRREIKAALPFATESRVGVGVLGDAVHRHRG